MKQIIHTSGVSPSDTGTENIIKINAEDGVMINFASVAAYTMPQTDEWTNGRMRLRHGMSRTSMTGCYLTPMHQKLIDNQPETAENQLELIPAGRWGHPYEMGALTAFLCSSGAGYVNGVDILADGGQNAGIFVPQI